MRSLIPALLALTLPASATLAQPLVAASPAPVEHVATGTFEVKVTPIPGGATDLPVGALHLDKSFTGDLSGKSVGVMLGAQTATPGSAGYVAMEQVTGTLNGKQGSFILQHSGSMQGGAMSMSVTVVPDSGTDGLKGIAGHMEIHIDGGTHSYRFVYTLPE